MRRPQRQRRRSRPRPATATSCRGPTPAASTRRRRRDGASTSASCTTCGCPSIGAAARVASTRDGDVWVSGHGGANDRRLRADRRRDAARSCAPRARSTAAATAAWSTATASCGRCATAGPVLRWDPSVVPPTASRSGASAAGCPAPTASPSAPRATSTSPATRQRGCGRSTATDLSIELIRRHGSPLRPGPGGRRQRARLDQLVAATAAAPVVSHLQSDGTFIGTVSGGPRLDRRRGRRRRQGLGGGRIRRGHGVPHRSRRAGRSAPTA